MSLEKAVIEIDEKDRGPNLPARITVQGMIMAVRFPGPANPAIAPLMMLRRSWICRSDRADWSVCGSFSS